MHLVHTGQKFSNLRLDFLDLSRLLGSVQFRFREELFTPVNSSLSRHFFLRCDAREFNLFSRGESRRFEFEFALRDGRVRLHLLCFDLQFSLLVAGVAVVAGVYAFNWWQERKFQRRVERAFDDQRGDALMGQSEG